MSEARMGPCIQHQPQATHSHVSQVTKEAKGVEGLRQNVFDLVARAPSLQYNEDAFDGAQQVGIMTFVTI